MQKLQQMSMSLARLYVQRILDEGEIKMDKAQAVTAVNLLTQMFMADYARAIKKGNESGIGTAV